MTKHLFVSTADSSLQTLSSTYNKDASTYASLLFDFVATGLRTIQFLFKPLMHDKLYLKENRRQAQCCPCFNKLFWTQFLSRFLLDSTFSSFEKALAKKQNNFFLRTKEKKLIYQFIALFPLMQQLLHLNSISSYKIVFSECSTIILPWVLRSSLFFAPAVAGSIIPSHSLAVSAFLQRKQRKMVQKTEVMKKVLEMSMAESG
jgi:hypothetical protein